MVLTSFFDNFWNDSWESTSIHTVHILDGEGRTVGWDAVASSAHCHRSLERISFPAKDVVSVLTKPSAFMPKLI
jgi:hypothetical protein